MTPFFLSNNYTNQLPLDLPDIDCTVAALQALGFFIGLLLPIIPVRLPAAVTSGLKKIFIELCIFLSLASILSCFHIYVRGYATTKIAVWASLFIATVIYTMGNRSVLSATWKNVTGWLFYFPIIIAVLFVIPLLGTWLFETVWGAALIDQENVFYDDDEIRIQKASAAPSFARRDVKLYKKGLLAEADEGVIYTDIYGDLKTASVTKTNDSATIYFYHTEPKNMHTFGGERILKVTDSVYYKYRK